MSAAATSELIDRPPNATLDAFFDNLDAFAETPAGVARLRELILEWAMRGMLTDQRDAESASVLVDHIKSAKQKLVKANKSRNLQSFKDVQPADAPFEIPTNWEWIRIGDAMALVNGRAFKPDEWSTSGLPIIRIQNLNNPDAPYNYCDFEVPEKVHVHEGDFLISWSGTPGTSFGAFIWANGHAVLNQHIFRAELIGEGYYKELLRLAINVRLDEMIAQAHGGVGLRHITKGKLENLCIPLPPLPEQRRIVAKVDALMSQCDVLESRLTERAQLRERASRSCLRHLMASRSRRNLSSAWQRLNDHFEVLYDTPETLADLRQSILQLAVQGKLVPQDPNDEPASTALERIRSRTNELIEAGELKKPKTVLPLEPNGIEGTLPASWQLAQLYDILSYGPRNGYSPKPVDFETPVKSLTLSATTSGIFDGRYVKFIDEEVPDDSYLWLRDGDILIQRSNSLDYVGITAIYRGPHHEFIYPDLMMKFRVNDEIEPDFLQLILRSQQSRTFFQTRATGTSGSMRKINQSIVVSVPIPLAPLAEQKRIVAKVDQLLSQCDELSARLRDRQATTQQLLAATIHHILDCSQ